MNKTTLLTAGLVTGIVVALCYSFLGDDVESTQTQQPVKVEGVQVKEQSAPSSNETKAVDIVSENKDKLTTSVAEEPTYVRRAPPPPISSTKSTKVAHSSPQAHGHEEVSDDQRRNAPPPPTGANQ
ncbi:MAG: hypothetical protein MJK12_14345 [Colwellia sp.]|nr:hypothetical protein [Colwellia sp.]